MTLTFREVEAVLGASLPNSKKYPAWWSNNPSNNPMTKVWLDAGFVTEQVDTIAEKLVFRRAVASERGAGLEEGPVMYPLSPKGRSGDWLARLRAELGGTVKVAPSWDLTSPAGEVWDAERE
ncbi:hypothetical protein [Phenylobacterium sp.]|uniref:DUF7662 domain-containing protein n=1 Tax=Phenylobacterium sp. TaxID=1871053 RepID=UPI0025CE5CC2|nr:hypothetical protein [Phenylobacterium sp.]